MGKKSCFYWLKYGNFTGRPMYLTMNYDLAESILILTKMKIMKLPVSRRLNTWNSDIFTRVCPFGCDKEDDEEHALLQCETSIIKDVKSYILNKIKDDKIRKKVKTF